MRQEHGVSPKEANYAMMMMMMKMKMMMMLMRALFCKARTVSAGLQHSERSPPASINALGSDGQEIADLPLAAS